MIGISLDIQSVNSGSGYNRPTIAQLDELSKTLYALSPDQKHVRLNLVGAELRSEIGNGNPLKGAQRSERMTVRIFPDSAPYETFNVEWGRSEVNGSGEPHVSGNLTLDVYKRIQDMLTTRRYVKPIVR